MLWRVLLLLVLGFGAGVAFEHRPPAGLPLSLLGRGLAAQRDDWRGKAIVNAANWRAMKADRDGWFGAHGQCEGARLEANERAAVAVADGFAVRAQLGRQGFDTGYAAGRTAGRLSCGAPLDPPIADPVAPAGEPGPDADADPDAAAAGLRAPPDDFAARWSAAAWRPAAAVRP